MSYYHHLIKTAIPVSYLLDTYTGASRSYGLWQLSSTNTNCIRVRRSSDNTEQNFGFVNGVVDTSGILSFCGAGSGYVTTLFDLSGGGENATQSTASLQYSIVLSGVLNVGTNGKPCLKKQNVASDYTFTSFSIPSVFSSSFVYDKINSNESCQYSNTANTLVFNFSNLANSCFIGSGAYANIGALSTNKQYSALMYKNSSNNSNVLINGVYLFSETLLGASSSSLNRLLNRTGIEPTEVFQHSIFWNGINYKNDFPAIETLINDYYENY